jgi:hypothetical protein
LILDRPFKNFHMRLSLRGHDAMLGQMTAERVDLLCPLPDQKIPRAEKHGARLLFFGFDRDQSASSAGSPPQRSLPRWPHRSFGA